MRASRFNGTTLEAARSTGVTDAVGKPAAVVHPDGKVQLVVRRADGRIHTTARSRRFPGRVAAWS